MTERRAEAGSDDARPPWLFDEFQAYRWLDAHSRFLCLKRRRRLVAVWRGNLILVAFRATARRRW